MQGDGCLILPLQDEGIMEVLLQTSLSVLRGLTGHFRISIVIVFLKSFITK